MKISPRQLSRRDFIRVAGLSILSLGIEPLLTACSDIIGKASVGTPVPTNLSPQYPTATPPLPTATPTPGTPTELPPLPTDEPVILSPRDQRRLNLIEKYGPATKALSLEFHGDEYWHYNGAYSMDTSTFTWLMTWLQENEVWAINQDELIGFLDGTLQLPARSVILTTDSGRASVESLQRMIPILQDTGMHFISFIWTMQMMPEETAACPNNLCWETFLKAKESGVFSFGTHSEYHVPLAEKDEAFMFKDISLSMREIEENLGITPQILGWPLESYPPFGEKIAKLGIKAAFGGLSRPLDQCSVYAQDPLRYNLPRLLPPNRQDRRSGRPFGMTIDDLAAHYMDGFGR